LVAIVLALYTLSTLSTFVLSSTIYLYIARLVDSTITASEILMVVSVSKTTVRRCRRSLTDGYNLVWLVSYIPTSSSTYGSTASKSRPFLPEAQAFTLRLFCRWSTYSYIMDGCLGCWSSSCCKTANVPLWEWRLCSLGSRRQLYHSQSQRGGVIGCLVSINRFKGYRMLIDFIQHCILHTSLFARNTRSTLPGIIVWNLTLCSAY